MLDSGRLTIPDPSILLQGDSTPSHKGIEKSVIHTKYVGPTRKFGKLSTSATGVYAHGLGSFPYEYLGPFEMSKEQYDVALHTYVLIARVDLVYPGGWHSLCPKDMGWHLAVWALPGRDNKPTITVTTGFFDRNDNHPNPCDNQPGIPSVPGTTYGKSWSPAGAPSYSRINAAIAVMQSECTNFTNMISGSLEKDLYRIVDDSNVVNRALEQLDASQSSDLNVLENVADLIGVAKDAKNFKFKSALRKFKSITHSREKFEAAKGSLTSFNSQLNKLLGSNISREHLTSRQYQKLFVENGLMNEWEVRQLSQVLNSDGSFKEVYLKKIEASAKINPNGLVYDASDAWLWYRYVYATTLLDANTICSGDYASAVESAAFLVSQWERAHATVGSSLVADDKILATGNHQFSTWARPNITNSVQQSVIDNHAMGLFTLTNAWDIVPFSFVVDWFLGVGDLLGRLDNLITLGAAHYEYDCSIDSWTFSDGRWHTYVRKPSTGSPHYDVSERSKYAPSERTKLKRVNDSVAMFLKRA
jgi:hypothetical protein